MRAGELDRKIQFRQATMVDDGLAAEPVFADFGSPVWASRRDVSDREQRRAGSVSASKLTRFVVRHSSLTSAIKPKDQIVTEGETFAIVGIRRIGKRICGFEITASADLDA
jgi:head-tail adaptor